MSEVKKVRIFLASPSADTVEARARVEQVVGEIGADPQYARRVRLELSRWDDSAWPVVGDRAGNPRQDIEQQVGSPGDCDLVIGIFAHTMGGMLPKDRFPVPAEREAPWFCTEWEVEQGLNAGRTVWVFQDLRPLTATTAKAKRESLAVSEYLELHNPLGGPMREGFNSFDDIDDLAGKLRHGLRGWLHWKFTDKADKPPVEPVSLNLLPPVMPFRWACAYGEDRIGLWQAFEVAGVRQVMRWIPPGEFLMGSPLTERKRESDERQHRVVLAEGFWMADTACTQALWEAVMGTNPSQFKDNPHNPVEQVNWLDITEEFLPKLNAMAPGLQLELPTEVQWEYACRAGMTTPFSFDDQVTTDQVNYDGNFPYAGGKKGEYRNKTVPVKALPANPWGLHQMHGNVWEWCHPEVAVDDLDLKVRRGGSFLSMGSDCRSAHRFPRDLAAQDRDTGFRLARRAG